jgi:hypothetical protein
MKPLFTSMFCPHCEEKPTVKDNLLEVWTKQPNRKEINEFLFVDSLGEKQWYFEGKLHRTDEPVKEINLTKNLDWETIYNKHCKFLQRYYKSYWKDG